MTEEELLKREHEIIKAEKYEVEKHKWHLSQQAGYDVGFEKAFIHWKATHWSKWISWFREQLDVKYRTEKAAEGAF